MSATAFVNPFELAVPTPLQRLARLSAHVGAELYIKRDDLLGVVLGGNKLRKLQRIVPAALAAGADTLVVTGSFESNLACLTVVVARMLGLGQAVVLMGPAGRKGQTLNERIIRQSQAELRVVEYDENDPATRQALTERTQQAVDELTAALRARGRRPWLVPPGGCCLEGSLAFVHAFDELHAQMAALGIHAYDLVLPVGTGSTFAGLWCGLRRRGAAVGLTGISIARRNPRCAEETVMAITRVCSALALAVPRPEELDIRDQFIGDGYGKATAWSRRGSNLGLDLEGLLLDSTYTGKCLGGLMEMLRERRPARPVVFWHTGGVAGAVSDRMG